MFHILMSLTLCMFNSAFAETITIHTSDRVLFAEKEDLEKYEYFQAVFSAGMQESETLELDWRSEYGPAVEIIMDYIKYGIVRDTDPATRLICQKISDKIFLEGFEDAHQKTYLIHQPMFEVKHSEHFLAGRCVVCQEPITTLSFYLHYQSQHGLETQDQDPNLFSKGNNNGEFYTPNLYISSRRKLARVLPLKIKTTNEQARRIEQSLLEYTHDRDD